MEQFLKISRADLKHWMDSGHRFVLVDVTGPSSYHERHLPHAKMVDVHQSYFVDQVKRLAIDKSTPVVVYCSGYASPLSTQAAAKLVEAGFTHVHEYKGGLADWHEGGYPFEK